MEKRVAIVINGVQKEVEKREYTFQEIVSLAFGSYDDSQKSYTIVSTLKNDDDGKHKKSYSLGDTINIKEGMRINVDSSNRS